MAFSIENLSSYINYFFVFGQDSICAILGSLPEAEWRAHFFTSPSPSNLYRKFPQSYGEKTAMGILHRIDRRREPRTEADLPVTVWGVDTRGDRFVQRASAREISFSGALLSGLEAELRSGDVIGILYSGRKARYRVIWVRYSDAVQKTQAAVHRIEPDACPWQELLSAQLAHSADTDK